MDPCPCGRIGCAENAVSGIGFTHQVKKYGRKDLLNPDTGMADTKKLFRLAQTGDKTCCGIVDYGAKTLANVIMNLVRFSDPDTIVYGGGILSDEWFMGKVRENLVPEIMSGVTKGLVPSTFSPGNAGLLGAASLGMEDYRIKRGKMEESTRAI